MGGHAALPPNGRPARGRPDCRQPGRSRACCVGDRYPGGVLNRCGGLGEGDYGPSLEQPDQAGLVVAGQLAVGRMRRRRRLVEAEQVARGPAKRLRLVAPALEERASIVDSELPAVDRDEVRAASVESGQDPAVAGRKIGESRTVRTVKTAKTLICG